MLRCSGCRFTLKCLHKSRTVVNTPPLGFTGSGSLKDSMEKVSKLTGQGRVVRACGCLEPGAAPILPGVSSNGMSNNATPACQLECVNQAAKSLPGSAKGAAKGIAQVSTWTSSLLLTPPSLDPLPRISPSNPSNPFLASRPAPPL